MNLNEYKTVESLNYMEYCDYLQNKYGIGVCDYMTPACNIKPKIKRTKEGLLAHHKFEDHAQKLSDPKEAKKYPFEWQAAQNIVYCDYLEHLFLHILICESKLANALEGEVVGIGGLIQYIIPELNDLYSGWETAQPWRRICHEKVLPDKDVYLTLIQRFKKNCQSYPFYRPEYLLSSYNAQYGLWELEKNAEIFQEIVAL